MPVELTEALLSKAAGWEVMKRARVYVSQKEVLSSQWAPPLLRGVVQAGETSFRASMVIKSDVDVENLCTCRDAREWGKICAHSVGVGLHWLQKNKEAIVPAHPATASHPVGSIRKTSALKRDPSGEPAELFIILPPNLLEALTRGKVMLYFEAKSNGGRLPLNTLPAGRSFAFTSKDALILDRIEELANGETPAMLQVAAKDFGSLLSSLAEHPNITLGKSVPVKVSKTPIHLPLRATLEASGEIVLSLKSESTPIIAIEGWIWRNNTFQPLALPDGTGEIIRQPVRVKRSHVPAFLNQMAQYFQAGAIEGNFKLEDFSLEPLTPNFLLDLKGGSAQLRALLQCAYGARIMTLGIATLPEDTWLPDPQNPTRYFARSEAEERAALARLQRSGFSAPDADGRMQLLGQNAVLNFFARDFPKLQREWSVTLEEKLERGTLQNFERIEPQFQVTSSGVQWFDLGIVFSTRGGEQFSPAEIQRLLLSGQSHARLKNGKVALLDSEAFIELQETLRDCAPQQHGQGYRLNNVQAGFLKSTLEQKGGWRLDAPAAWRERAQRQSGEAELHCPPLEGLENVLRPYQKHGVAWMHFLRENGFGGILADEMGLGKTLQTLAFFCVRNHLRLGRSGEGTTPPAPSSPSLIVCPTSLVFNWIAEARKFTPSLRMLALQGPERHALFDQVQQSDVVVTSYALIRRDAERYREFEFDTVVLDEAQHIKNRQTQNAQAVKAIKSNHRIVLTGTPMENSVLDLWSIFDFLMPGYLGTAQEFRERYELPIVREKDASAQSRLARRLRPFMLRRLKKEVAADLPAKLEQVSFCELTNDQRNVYQQVIEASRKEILDAVGVQGLAKSRMVVLSALLRLRQICCDLRLLQLDRIEPSTASGKLDLFNELLEEVIDGGHRVLVFSQFVSMLTLIKQQLDAEGIEFCYLDGSTTDRASVVERFQRGGAPVFLISLKAGGVGLNLTGADTVIHFDPWWNPAVEDQATDRAHRIGQTKVVTSYKLIARDTVEEKILLLQNRKREIIKGTIGGEEEFAEALNWEEIQELLN